MHGRQELVDAQFHAQVFGIAGKRVGLGPYQRMPERSNFPTLILHDAAQGGDAWRPQFRESNDGQALAALPASGGKHLAAAPCGLSCAKADLAGSFLTVRAEGGLHDVVSLRVD